MVFLRTISLLAAVLLMASCGGSSNDIQEDVASGSPPLVTSLSPTSGPVGTEVTVTGIGYSYIPPNNTIMIGSESTVATAHDFLTNPTSSEFETVTFTVPDTTPLGADSVVVIVGDYASNTDVLFTVTP